MSLEDTMSLEEINELGEWPFSPESLTPSIPQELLAQTIGGISEYLRAPVIIMELKGCDGNEHLKEPHFIYPAKQEVDGGRKAIENYRYPKFCKQFLEIFPEAERLCREDGICRSKDFWNPEDRISETRCHLGVNICMERITYLGKTVAICTSGKFLNDNDIPIIERKLEQLKSIGPLSSENADKLLKSALEETRKDNFDDFKKKFSKEISYLSELVKNSFDTIREKKEWICREQVTQVMYETGNKPDDIVKSLENVLKALRSILPIKFLTLFFADRNGARVLPLVAQDGMDKNSISSVHFNWRKAGLPSRDRFKTLKWLDENKLNKDFPKDFVVKGVKGAGKEFFANTAHMIPMGRDFRGVLLIGPWSKENFSEEAKIKGQDFIQSIGHLLIANALSKIALTTSFQNDRRRDLIVAMTAHSINHKLHTIWNYLSLVQRYTKGERLHQKVLNSIVKMQDSIKIMKKNVRMAMSAPETAVLPSLSRYEMEMGDVNLAVLLHNCADMLEPRYKDKEISIEFDEDIENLPLILGDKYMLQLMFSNIFDNAIKYSKVGKIVNVRCRNNPGKMCQVIIEDLGWGIPEDDLEKIFDEGYRNPDVVKGKIIQRAPLPDFEPLVW